MTPDYGWYEARFPDWLGRCFAYHVGRDRIVVTLAGSALCGDGTRTVRLEWIGDERVAMTVPARWFVDGLLNGVLTEV